MGVCMFAYCVSEMFYCDELGEVLLLYVRLIEMVILNSNSITEVEFFNVYELSFLVC